MSDLFRTISKPRLLPVFAGFLLATIALAGCSAPTSSSSSGSVADASSEIQMDWQFTPKPAQVGEAQWTVTLKDRAGKPVNGAKITLEGNMSHPGMQPVMASMNEAAPGRYKAPLNFTMGGDWFVLIDATLKDGRTLHKQCDIPNVRDK